MKKKILQINTVCGVGSTGRIAKDIAELAETKGMECYIAYGYGNTDFSNRIKIGTKIEYYIHNILSRILCMQGRFSYFATKRFLKEVDDIKPDLIHLHNIHGNYINYKLLFEYIKKKSIPVIWTLHDCWPFTGKCTYFDAVKCNKWQSDCNKCRNLREYPKSYCVNNTKGEYKNKKNSFSNVENMTIVTPSKWLKDNVKQSFLKQYEVKVINNGIDLNKFKFSKSKYREELNLEDKIVLLGVASEWTKRKGLNSFEALAELLDEKYKIVLLGIDNKQKSEISDKILTIPKTNSIEELAQIYSMADIFINPTLEDNFPTTNLEALACGTPVITYRTGGSPESIDSECGAIVEKENINELMENIEKIIYKKIEKEKCIEKSKNFNKKDKFLEYIELYENILKLKEN